MIHGLAAGLLWALDSVILGVALASTPFLSTEQAIMLAPFVSTFIHDFCSAAWMLLFMGIKKEYGKVIRAFRTRSGKFIVLGALLGGPIGMTGYVMAINYIGVSYTAIISSLFPAVGAFLSYIFLKEKMKWYQLVGLVVSIIGVIFLGYTPNSGVKNLLLGFIFALVCVFGWAAEAVICAYGMKDPDVSDEQALQIRQLTSAICYSVILLPLLRAWSFTTQIAFSGTSLIILMSALFGTASYVFYYRAINKIGASKAMALNITYSAWSILFAFIFFRQMPSVLSIICALVILGGSIVAASDIKEVFGKVSLNVE